MAEIRVIEVTNTYVHLALEGRLDSEGVDGIATQFTVQAEARRRPTIVELSGVTFLASLGIGMLVRAARSLRRHGAGLVLVSPAAPVDGTLRAAKIDAIIPIVRDRAEALRSLGAA